MSEEELFCKLYPEYAVNGKPLSPYFDLFESGYEEAEERLKKYMDCEYCEYVNDKDECHQCNYLEKTRWTLKKEIKENE